MPTLDSIHAGVGVRLRGFKALSAGLRQKLLALGLTPGVSLTVLQVAPYGGPRQLRVRNSTLSLRSSDCQQLEVEFC